jgi:hypothetical protein
MQPGQEGEENDGNPGEAGEGRQRCAERSLPELRHHAAEYGSAEQNSAQDLRDHKRHPGAQPQATPKQIG